MGRIKTSIHLFKASWAVVRQDKELLALPVISALAAAITIGLFAFPVYTSIDFNAVATDGSETVTASPITYLLGALAYFVLAFIGIFFNSALVHASNERMNGGDPTLGSALRGAASKVNRILPWAIISATVSQIIRAIQERAGFLGSILGFLGGLAWAAVTFLVLPILIIEDIGPVDAIKRSASLLKNAWGEGLAGHAGLGIIGFLAALPFLLIGVVGFASGSAVVLIPTLLVAAIGIVLVIIVMSALSIVYQTALYRFATSQTVPAFDDQLMQEAFTAKKR